MLFDYVSYAYYLNGGEERIVDLHIVFSFIDIKY